LPEKEGRRPDRPRTRFLLPIALAPVAPRRDGKGSRHDAITIKTTKIMVLQFFNGAILTIMASLLKT